ncbi:helix-turn-helix domain-containing protein [Microbacterium imperiale]|uniref:HTH cro/C1-type domain-containing protein n=1 Tax=Microbacterium imperiale TaxID=33884 RepID=A0A9W6HEH1_9MICO|nr:helix-turn-helix transcriptional regulator [Microbacterium imperiale]MBP2419660.1 transcriptional regulator with XRE-family HTH domain [Microbacterium imperiale]MDS0198474.1 helix-turn-helix transcriptional regulator [Microbacterium imperiale]BFE40001.1 hypothetical protein GCM10017544_09570 [Microbacterium imperiale]GLJ79024.1 hypothetical protein GCM10017586_07060 [Microbacterium imperiale]
MDELEPPALGYQVAKYRRMLKISGEELAARAGLGLTRSVIANLENGRKRDVTVQQLIALALVLGVSPADLVFDLRRPYDLVPLGDTSAPESYASTTTGQVLARSWFGGSRLASEMSYRTTVQGPDDADDLSPLHVSDDAYKLTLIQKLLDQRASAAYALAAHEQHLLDVDRAASRGEVIRGGFLPNDLDTLRIRVRDFRAELYEVDRQLRSYGVAIDEPILYPGVPF